MCVSTITIDVCPYFLQQMISIKDDEYNEKLANYSSTLLSQFLLYSCYMNSVTCLANSIFLFIRISFSLRKKMILLKFVIFSASICKHLFDASHVNIILSI